MSQPGLHRVRLRPASQTRVSDAAKRRRPESVSWSNDQILELDGRQCNHPRCLIKDAGTDESASVRRSPTNPTCAVAEGPRAADHRCRSVHTRRRRCRRVAVRSGWTAKLFEPPIKEPLTSDRPTPCSPAAGSVPIAQREWRHCGGWWCVRRYVPSAVSRRIPLSRRDVRSAVER